MKTGLLQFPAQIMSILTKLDCLKVVVETSGPLPSGMTKVLLDYQQEGCRGWFTFNRDEIQPDDLTDLPPMSRVEKGKKSRSQQLRAVLFRNWEQDRHGYDDSEKYYNYVMDRLIETYKEKLD